MHLLLLAAAIVAPAAAAKPLEFQLTFPKAALAEPFTGRVYVMLHPRDPGTLPKMLNWFDPQPTFAMDVKNWKPDTPLVIRDTALSHPVKLKAISPGTYFVQAVMDRDLGGISFAASEGNVYSTAKKRKLDPKASGRIEITLDQVFKAPKMTETETVKLVEIESKLLTKFHGRPIRMQAGVILPPSFLKNPKKKYPIVYEIPGFGGSHLAAPTIAKREPWNVDGVEMIWVILNPECRLGHHVFADSANNGPWGQAFVTELIPAIEKRYHAVGKPEARLVTGHSSGGWSSLWLQITYPDFFGGCWSTSPDPVDFRDFQKVDLSQPKVNLFTDETGKVRPLSRLRGQHHLTFRGFSDMETVMGRGGQLGSFEAVFSPKGEDGLPQPLWDRKTGLVDPKTVAAWEKYDIRRILETNWKTLEPKLAGKIHVWIGEEDTFLLEGATRLLKESLHKLGSDAEIELIPKKTHALMDAELRKRMNREMAAQVSGKK